jgi:hypothetical protein
MSSTLSYAIALGFYGLALTRLPSCKFRISFFVIQLVLAKLSRELLFITDGFFQRAALTATLSSTRLFACGAQGAMGILSLAILYKKFPSAPSKLDFGWSIVGAFFASLYLASFLGTLGYVNYSTLSNGGESGESGILLLLFSLPWTLLIPGPVAAFFAVPLNAFVIFCIAGGVRAIPCTHAKVA